ncbi:uncharacterized protein [Rutidosis leptorrhynchoides]|uniref:uncharacterized protein n=1 Tax=Rutidosis leptorrhynchoides TaxID=125765 RepID=UPI003A99BB23
MPISYTPGESNVEAIDRSLTAREEVYVKLQPRRQVTLRRGKQHKLSPKYSGPFEILERVGKVAYKLLLPEMSKVHPVFHVSQLKHHYGSTTRMMGTLPRLDETGVITNLPLKILDRRMVKRNNIPVIYGLIQWVNGTIEDAMWEPLEDIMIPFPDLDVLSNDS